MSGTVQTVRSNWRHMAGVYAVGVVVCLAGLVTLGLGGLILAGSSWLAGMATLLFAVNALARTVDN